MSELRPIETQADRLTKKCTACATKLRTPDEIVWKPVWGIANRALRAPFCAECSHSTTATLSVDGSRLVIVEH